MVTIEWTLWQGSGGMAAQMCAARIKGQLNRIALQHKWSLTLTPGETRYKLQCELTEQQLTILSLQWQIENSFEKWRVIK